MAGRITDISKNYFESAEGIGWHAAGDISLNAGTSVKMYGKGDGIILGKNDPIKTTVADFNISLQLDKSERSFVPLSIASFDGDSENGFFLFDYMLSGSEIEQLLFDIKDEKGNVIYSLGYLQPVIVRANEKPVMLRDWKKERKEKTFDFSKFLDKFKIEQPVYTKPGHYTLVWDGFDNNGIYDSAAMRDKKFTAKIKGTKGDKAKEATCTFSTPTTKVDWVDLKADKNAKKIEVTVKVNLRDGGEVGIGTETYKDPMDDPRYPSFRERNKAEAVPKSVVQYYKLPPITQRTKTFEQLRDLALKGIGIYWSRTSQRTSGNMTKINGEQWEVTTKALQDEENGMVAPKIIYFTNEENTRFNDSHNWELSRELYYKEGYVYDSSWKKYPGYPIYINKGWKYAQPNDTDFEMVSAHEIGHEILLRFGGQFYSKTHKDSSSLAQDDNGTPLPQSGEIDLMKYYATYYDYKRTVVAEEDMLGLLWLTKLGIR